MVKTPFQIAELMRRGDAGMLAGDRTYTSRYPCT